MSDLATQPPLLGPSPDIPGLEADLAFFEARLSLLTGMPDSLYLRAQLRTYHALEEAVHGELDSLRRDSKKSR
jgi:hypothetical protein